MLRIVPRGVAVALAAFTLSGWLGARALSQQEPRALPDYRGWTHLKSALVGPKNPLYDAEGGFHHVYANDRAMEGLRTGVFRDGAMLVYDLLEAREDNGLAVEGPRRRVDLMVKGAADRVETGGWDFRRFLGPERRETPLTAQDRADCFACHRTRKDRDFVFSGFRD